MIQKLAAGTGGVGVGGEGGARSGGGGGGGANTRTSPRLNIYLPLNPRCYETLIQQYDNYSIPARRLNSGVAEHTLQSRTLSKNH